MLRFRTMFGEDVGSQRSKYKMGRSSGRIQMSASHGALLGIDGEPIEFEWNSLPGFSSLQILPESQDDLRERNIEPEKFTDRIIFMSMFNDIDWTRKGNEGICIANSEKVKKYAKRFSPGHCTFLVPADEKKLYGIHLYTPEGKWDSTAAQMVDRFKDTGHPAFKSISPLSRGILKKKITKTPYASMRMLQTPSSCPEPFIL